MSTIAFTLRSPLATEMYCVSLQKNVSRNLQSTDERSSFLRRESGYFGLKATRIWRAGEAGCCYHGAAFLAHFLHHDTECGPA
jgi:hypothetical protein